jgi:hypothetical protein
LLTERRGKMRKRGGSGGGQMEEEERRARVWEGLKGEEEWLRCGGGEDHGILLTPSACSPLEMTTTRKKVRGRKGTGQVGLRREDGPEGDGAG